MRKSLVLLLALLLVVSIAVCACKKDEAPVESDAVETTTPAEETTSAEETKEAKAALKPITKDDNNVVEGDWSKRY